MTFPSYPAYKDSGVEWLGEVPEHWTVIALKWLSPVFRGASPRPIDDPIYFDDEGEFGWVRIADVTASPDGYLYETTQKLSALGSSLSVKLDPGELFLSIAGSVGKPCITKIKACIHDGFVYFPWLSIDQRLLYRVFESGLCFGGLGKMGTQLNLNTDTVGGIIIAVPPAPELSKALTFLDHETARIDALIEEQQRLIKLLKEKRQAVISHAVTKGLDPTVPMKDSGVEWLGEVPAHWDVKALRRVIKKSLSNGVFKKKEDFGRGVLLVNVFDVYRQSFQVDYSSLERVDCNAAEISSYSVLPGDLFFVRSSLKYEGIAVVAVAGECSESVVYECHLICARPDPALLNGRYGSYLFNSSNYRATMISKAKLTTMTTIDQEAISSTLIPTPPLSEQAEISAFLDREIDKVDQLIGEADSVCELLKERRSALISAAVTGKIDVRGWQPPASAQAPELAVAEAH